MGSKETSKLQMLDQSKETRKIKIMDQSEKRLKFLTRTIKDGDVIVLKMATVKKVQETHATIIMDPCDPTILLFIRPMIHPSITLMIQLSTPIIHPSTPTAMDRSMADIKMILEMDQTMKEILQGMDQSMEGHHGLDPLMEEMSIQKLIVNCPMPDLTPIGRIRVLKMSNAIIADQTFIRIMKIVVQMLDGDLKIAKDPMNLVDVL